MTGLELFTPHYLELVWKDKDGKHQRLLEPGYVRLDNLMTLADRTQRLYFGMPPYWEWRDTYYTLCFAYARSDVLVPVLTKQVL